MDDVIVEHKAVYSQIIIISYKLARVGVSWVIARSQGDDNGGWEGERVTREARASGDGVSPGCGSASGHYRVTMLH